MDDNTPCNFEFSLDNLIGSLEKSTNSLLNWFGENHKRAYADKCHHLMNSNKSCSATLKVLVSKAAPKKNHWG